MWFVPRGRLRPSLGLGTRSQRTRSVWQRIGRRRHVVGHIRAQSTRRPNYPEWRTGRDDFLATAPHIWARLQSASGSRRRVDRSCISDPLRAHRIVRLAQASASWRRTPGFRSDSQHMKSSCTDTLPPRATDGSTCGQDWRAAAMLADFLQACQRLTRERLLARLCQQPHTRRRRGAVS